MAGFFTSLYLFSSLASSGFFYNAANNDPNPPNAGIAG